MTAMVRSTDTSEIELCPCITGEGGGALIPVLRRTSACGRRGEAVERCALKGLGRRCVKGGPGRPSQSAWPDLGCSGFAPMAAPTSRKDLAWTMSVELAFETDRLVVRELLEEDLEPLLRVYASNPDYLAPTEGSAGQPGRYDLEMLKRDLHIAHITPGRWMAGLFLKPSGEAVGVLDWMQKNPSDGKPWIGLLMVRADLHRQGLATEAFKGLAAELLTAGCAVVRAGVIKRNPAGLALTQRLGFRPVSIQLMKMALRKKCSCSSALSSNRARSSRANLGLQLAPADRDTETAPDRGAVANRIMDLRGPRVRAARPRPSRRAQSACDTARGFAVGATGGGPLATRLARPSAAAA